MKNIYKQFLDVVDIMSQSIRTWTNALKRNNNITNRTEHQLVPVPVKKGYMILVLFLALNACGENRSTEQQQSTDMQTMGTQDEAFLQEREQTDSVPGVSAERVVDMEAKDHVFFPREITASPGEQFYINLINGGNEPHNVNIELPQAPLKFGEPVPVGNSRKLLVAAPTQPGKYQIYCPVKDHRQRGMIATLVVE